jgi:hypothetical protein
VGATGDRSPRYIADALGFDPAYRMRFLDPHENLEAAGLEFIDERRWKVSCAIAVKIFWKKRPRRSTSNAQQAARSWQAMRDTIMIFAMIASLLATWHVAHWVMRLIVTEYGIIGGLVACGVIYVTSLMMDHYGL